MESSNAKIIEQFWARKTAPVTAVIKPTYRKCQVCSKWVEKLDLRRWCDGCSIAFDLTTRTTYNNLMMMDSSNGVINVESSESDSSPYFPDSMDLFTENGQQFLENGQRWYFSDSDDSML